MKPGHLQRIASRLAADLDGDQSKKSTQWKSFLKQLTKSLDHGVKELEQIIFNVNHNTKLQDLKGNPEAIQMIEAEKENLVRTLKSKSERLQTVMEALKEAESDLDDVYSAINALEESAEQAKESKTP